MWCADVGDGVVSVVVGEFSVGEDVVGEVVGRNVAAGPGGLRAM